MKRRLRKVLTILGIAASVLVCGFLVWIAIPVPVPRPAPPNPNGYLALLRASEMLPNNIAELDFRQMDETGLRSVVEGSTNAIALARTGLGQGCCVPDVSSSSPAQVTAHIADLASLKRLAFGFVAESQLMEFESRTNEAAKSCLDLIHLGIKSSRGGSLIDLLVGIAIEQIGKRRLRTLVGALDEDTCRKAAADLESFDAERETWENILSRDLACHGALVGLGMRFARIMDLGSVRSAQTKSEGKFKQNRKDTRRLAIELAARAYELDKGKKATGISDLVPEYLPTAPLDPITGTNMTYSP